MENFTINKEARRLAEESLAQAGENESQITADLQNIAPEVFAQVVGLEGKCKTKESLCRKLLLLARKDNSNQSIQKKLEKFARRNNDTLRYTFVFQDDEFAQGFRNAVEMLKQKGFVIPSNRVWNAWENEGTARDTGYRGINITVVSSQNQRFELQFHTKESFRLKTETHYFYETLRELKISDKHREKIIKVMLLLAKQINRPKGV